MKRDQTFSCARAQVLIEPYLDGELRGARLERMDAHLAACTQCRDELATARRIQDGLRTLPRLSCPDVVADYIMRRVAAPQPEGRWARVLDRLAQALGGSVLRPVAAAMAVIAVAVAIGLLSHQPLQNGYSPQEVARAEVEARYAFAIVAQVTTRASDTALKQVFGGVVREVVGDQVILPITDAVQRPFLKPPQEREQP